MPTFHIGSYMQMGDDFDSRNRFLRIRADGAYEGIVASGETWAVGVDFSKYGSVALIFKMDSYVMNLAFANQPTLPPSDGAIRVSSE